MIDHRNTSVRLTEPSNYYRATVLALHFLYLYRALDCSMSSPTQLENTHSYMIPPSSRSTDLDDRCKAIHPYS